MQHLKYKNMNIVKRLYNWVLSWSESKWGALALFILAFEEIATIIK